jgi:signal transduction histidine kinase
MAVGQGAAVALARRSSFAATTLVLICYAGQSLVAGVVPPFAAWVVIWSVGSSRASDAGSVKLPSVVAAGTSGVVVLAELTHTGSGASALLVMITVVITLAAILLRSERARIEAVKRQGGAEERLRIARDLHDLVGHGLSVVAIQSSTGRMALDAGDSATARAAMSAVEASSRTAMGELRQMLGVLSDDASEAPSPGIGDIAALVENVRTGGVVVDLEITGSFDAMPRATQLSAYRIVQEGLTNALKHAPGSLVQVRVCHAHDRLTVTVESSGGSRAQPAGDHTGFGLEGLRARVAALSGNLRSVRTTDGWLLDAEIPVAQPDAPSMPLSDEPS